MIKAQELKIGNWVEDIKPYDGKYLKIRWENIGKVATGARQYRPIPLTPEILEKAGFEKQVRAFVKGEIELWVINNDVHYSVHDDYPISVKYVHQLQNLYFALTGGKELEINL